ncbi:hypothetical protein C8J57DRAFT_1246907 [Mycena rebaudengoi]|nr:hypothetical protein C8J57DRAFT_1246907 [Mycena rebaudengoi]
MPGSFLARKFLDDGNIMVLNFSTLLLLAVGYYYLGHRLLKPAERRERAGMTPAKLRNPDADAVHQTRGFLLGDSHGFYDDVHGNASDVSLHVPGCRQRLQLEGKSETRRRGTGVGGVGQTTKGESSYSLARLRNFGAVIFNL